jgi:hypothetical protein
MTREQIVARLEKVNAAIDAALLGKKFKVASGGTERELERQSLSDLMKMQQLLVSQLARIDGSGGVRHVVAMP